MIENGYEQIYAHSRENYEGLLRNYTAIVNMPEYKDAVYGAPFAFLRALYLAKCINYYATSDVKTKPVFEFTSVQDALSTYNDMTNFSQITKDLLDKASLIVQADNVAEKINSYVKLSDYLEDSLAVSRNTSITPIARECVSVLPQASKEISPELRYDMLKDMLNTFNEKQIGILAAKGVFTAQDIDPLLGRVSSDTAKKNMSVLLTGFHVTSTLIKRLNLHLKGVTFANEDGSSRQEAIKELDEYIRASGIHPSLAVELYTYRPDMGTPEPACRLKWGDKCLGNLPRETAIQLHDTYTDKLLSADVVNVVGGNGGDKMTYGVEISLDIREPITKETPEVAKNEAEQEIA